MTDSNPIAASTSFRHRARYVVALVTVTVVSLMTLWVTRQAVLLVFLGLTVGVLFYYTSAWLNERTGLPRGAALAIVVVAVLGIGVASIMVGGPRVVGEARTLIDQAPVFLETAKAQLGLPPDAIPIPTDLGAVSGRVLGVFSTLFGVFAGVLVVLLVAIYTAINPSIYTAAPLRLVDRRREASVRHVLDRCAGVLLAWLKGVGIAFAALGVVAAVGLTLIGLPGALALAAFAAALTIIPNFGPFIGWAPAIVVGFSQGTTTGLWTLGLAIVAQQIEGSVITPKVQGDLIQVGPAIIVAGQIVLGALAGFLGILLVVPILGVGKVLLQELYIGPIVAGEAATPEGEETLPAREEAAPAERPLDAEWTTPSPASP